MDFLMDHILSARIQNRRGQRRNMPQPLLPGEFGVCLDTKQVFVGLDPNDTASVMSPTIEIFSDFFTVDANIIGNDVIAHINDLCSSIYILELTVPGSFPDINSDPDDLSSNRYMAYVLDENSNVVAAIVAANTVAEPFNLSEIDSYGDVTVLDSVLQFLEKSVTLPSPYTVAYSSAIVSAINSLNMYPDMGLGGTLDRGLVTMAQNIELSTTAREFENKVFTVQRILSPNTEFELTNLFYHELDSTAFDISYSVSSSTGVYSRSGKFTLTVSKNDSLITDIHNEIIDAGTVSLLFTTDRTAAGVDILYKLSHTLVDSDDLILRVYTNKWRSF